MKNAIKISSLILTAFILFVTASAFADSNLDPKIIIGDPTCEGCTPITGTTFGFVLPDSQGSTFNGKLEFQNASGTTWYSLFLTESAVSYQNVQCGITAYFNFCQAIPDKNNPSQTIIEFLNTLPNPGTGIADGGVFTLDFEAVDGNSWMSGTSFDGQANATSVPEPRSTTMLFSEILLLAGAFAVLKRNAVKTTLANVSLNTR